MADVLMTAVIGSALIAALAYYLIREKRRPAEFQKKAGELGFAYSLQAPQEPGFDAMSLFSKDAKQRLYWVLKGSVDSTEVLLFKYSENSRRDASTQTVAVFRIPDAALPDFRLDPRNFLDSVIKLDAGADFSADSHPGFSKNYRLLGRNSDALRALFQPPLLELFEKSAGWSVERGGGWLAVYRRGRLVAPDSLRSFLDEARALRAALTGKPSP